MPCDICISLKLELQLTNNDRLPEFMVWKAYDRLSDHRSRHNANDLCHCGKSFGDRSHTINYCLGK